MPRVTVSQPQAVKVQVNNQQKEQVQAISYGVRTLRGATDLNMAHAGDGDVIVYHSDTNSFVVEPIYDTSLDIDNGYF